MTASDLPDFAASQLFLRRLAYRLVREEGLAEDLVQETWRTWLERAPAGLSEPRAWMSRVLRNLAFTARREKERRSAREFVTARTESVAAPVRMPSLLRMGSLAPLASNAIPDRPSVVCTWALSLLVLPTNSATKRSAGLA